MLHTSMTRPEDPTPHDVDALDDVLVAVQRVPRRPGYRRRLLESVPIPGGLGTFRTLRAVERLGPAPGVGEVAEALAVDPSTASRVVERCVEAGLLSRAAHAEDRRRSVLALTPRGAELLDQVTANRRRVIAEVVADWDRDDVVAVVGLLERLLADLEALEGPA